MRQSVAVWLLMATMLAGLGLDGCDRAAEQQQDQATDLAPKPNQLPPLELRDDTADLLLTWVDEQGDFHVVQKPSEVPQNARERVRVVITTSRDGTGKLLYVADLRNRRPDGTYPVQTMTRAQWEEVGAARPPQ